MGRLPKISRVRFGYSFMGYCPRNPYDGRRSIKSLFKILDRHNCIPQFLINCMTLGDKIYLDLDRWYLALDFFLSYMTYEGYSFWTGLKNERVRSRCHS